MSSLLSECAYGIFPGKDCGECSKKDNCLFYQAYLLSLKEGHVLTAPIVKEVSNKAG